MHKFTLHFNTPNQLIIKSIHTLSHSTNLSLYLGHYTMNRKNVYTLLIIFSCTRCLSQNLVPFKLDNLWGYKNQKGIVKIKPQYQYASKFFMASAIVAKNDTLAAIDTNNRTIIPFKYQFLKQIDSTEFLFGNRAKYFGEYTMGVITKDQKIKIVPAFSYISKYNGCYTVTKEEDSLINTSPNGDLRSIKNTYGLYNKNGEVLIPCEYDNLSYLNDSLIVLSKGQNQALFNKKGEQLTAFVYMVIGEFYDEIAKVRIGDKFGFIYPNGKVAIPIIFEYCEVFEKEHAIFKQKNKWGAIDKHGKVVIKPKYEYDKLKNLIAKKHYP